MRKMLALIVVVGLVAAAIRQFDMLGDGGGTAGNALRSGIHSLTGKTVADLGRETMTYASRARVARAVREYATEHGRLPRDLDELVERGFMEADGAVDEWGRALAVESTGDGITLRSAGPDGRFHSDDDWTLDL